MNPVILEKRYGIKINGREIPITYNHLRPGDMLYVPPDSQNGYLIFVEHTLDDLLFIQVWGDSGFGIRHHSSRRKIPRNSVAEGDMLLEDAGWELYRP